LRRGAFDHSIDGYILILFTPLASVPLTLVLASMSQNYILLGWNVSVAVLLTIGIALYVYGYLRREAQPSRAEVIFLSLFVILWGVFTYLVATWLLTDAVNRSMNPGMRALTIWDHARFWTWEMKGLFGIGTGLLLIITLPLKRNAQQTESALNVKKSCLRRNM